MRPNLNTLQQHISALCMLLALMFVPSTLSANSDNVQAEEVYLLTVQDINGTTGNYNVPSNHQFTNSSGAVYTYTITSMPATGFSFRIGVKGWDKDMQPYTDGDALTIGGSYTITTDCYGKGKAWKVSYTEGEYKSLTITVDLSTSNRYVKITGVKSSTGGGTSTTCAPGLYIAGDKYGKTGDQYIYKLQRNKDKQYYISLNAINGAEWSGVQSYESGQGIDNYYVRTIGQTYHLVYIDDQGKETDYYPSTNGYTLTGSDPNTGSDKTKDFSTTPTSNWEIGVLNSGDANGGIYNFYVNTDVNGVPQNWYYEADETKVVAYEVNESTHTTDAYLYCTRENTTGAYNKNFFGMVSFVKDGYLSFLFADKTYGRRKNSTSTYDQDAAADSPNAFQFSKDRLDTGIYSTEFNPSRGNYIITGDKKPSRIFIIGSALNSNLSDTFTEWDPTNAVEMPYSIEEGCYKATVTLNKDKQFRFLLDHNESGAATSLDNNFGEDANKPGVGGDTDYNNKVQVESSSSTGENIVFNPVTDNYIVRFYVERKADKQGFQWTNDYGIYRYTIEKPERLNATITPPTATVDYAASLTPKVAVVGTNATTRTYAFTIDGTDPVINTTTGEAGNTSTKVVTYDYDEVIPTNDIGTFYMAPGNVLTFIDKDGKEHTNKNSTTVTVKAQAVQTVTKGSKYRLEGDIATGKYVFKTAGEQPTGNYTVTVTNNKKVSVNKAVATVEAKKDGVADPDVDVYYTTDGTDPLYSASARIVRDRTITIYSKPGKVWNSGTIKVAIPNTKATASCNYDITYSTSEGGYKNYLNNKIGDNVKDIGGDGHVVVYVQPFEGDASFVQGVKMQVFINAYEKLVDANGKVSYKSLTTAQQPLDRNSVISDPNVGENGDADWYYVDLVPTEGYKEINVTLGYVPEDEPAVLTQATVANVCKDMFLRYDLSSGNTKGQITDVTYQHTLGEHFYTTGDGGTKTDAANPTSGQAFFYAQVPLAWVSGNNTLKVYNGTSELTGATLTKQNGAETSDYSCVYKISVPKGLAENTELTLKPNNGTKDGSESWKIKYQNGGYYFYESSSHYSTVAPLVFSQDNDETKDTEDMRKCGYSDINKTSFQTSDYTCALNPTWKYSPSLDNQPTEVTNNWNGNEATVNVIPKSTTISQTPVYSFYSESDNSEQDNSEQDNNNKCVPVTVQMIVRGEKGAKATLKLQSLDSEGEATSTVATDTMTFSGYDSQGTVTTDGRVESLLTDTKNGWQKLEATLTPTAKENGNGLSISLTAEGGALQLSDVTLLEAANTDGHVWTTAPTNSTTTEYDLSKRSKANAYSFFDRGENKNAIIYANVNTVVGMSENTYDVAAATPVTTTSAKAAKPRRAIGGGGGTGSGGGPAEPTEYTYSGGKLVLYDNLGSNTSQHSWGTSKSTTWASFTYDRKFYGTTRSTGTRNTICLPFAMNQNQITSIFGSNAKIYQISSFDKDDQSVAYGDKVTSTSANKPYVLEITEDDNDGVSLNSQIITEATPEKADDISTSIGEDTNPSYFVGEYSSSKRIPREDNGFTYYVYDADKDGIFRIVSTKGANVKPFRAYLKVRRSTSAAKPFYFFKVNDNTTTAIDEVAANATWSSNAPVYNLQGQMVRRAGETTSLPKGIYIQNGRKFIQK